MIKMLPSFSVCYFKKNMVYVILTFGKFTKTGIKKKIEELIVIAITYQTFLYFHQFYSYRRKDITH